MNTKVHSIGKRFLPAVCLAMAASFGPTSVAHAEWVYGIGTGLGGQRVSGTQGINTVVGPVKFDVELSPSDFRDLTKSAFGFGGFATDGKWLIQYSLLNLELEDDSTAVVGANTVSSKINFKNRGGEVTVAYPVHRTSTLVVLVEGGMRYTKHEYDSTLTVSGAINTQQNRNFSHGWTDALVGASVNVPLAPQWTWNNRFNAGFGGSEGTFFASTGIGWKFHKSWSAALAAKFQRVKFENGNPGDSDWYLYDVDEAGVGLNVLYSW